MWSLVHNALLLLSPSIPSNHLLPAGEPSHLQPSQRYHDTFLTDGGSWHTALEKAQNVVVKMTLEEKVNLTTAVTGPCQANSGGVPRLGIPGLCFNDGPTGPRYTDFITQWPSAFTVAASFDRDLVEARAVRIGKEFRGKGINVELGPVTGGPLGRSPYAGRNWEAFTPDPYLSSTLSFLTVRGMQSSGLITCAKHYILYEQEPVCDGPLDNEGGRTGCRDVSSEVDDKTMRELYLPSFAETVRAGTGAIMCSYNKINGTAACESDDALNRILKDELGFKGLILTPWYASKQNGDYPKVNYQKYDLSDRVDVNGKVFRNEHVDNRGDNHLFARKVAAESTVLLKNSGVLPLKGVRRIGVFGSDADYPPTLSGCGPDLFCMVESKRRYWNGTVTIGGGSGAAYADYIAAPIEAISWRARQERIRVDQVLHDDSAHYGAMSWVAYQSEVCIVFVSLFLVEGWDREHLRLDKEGEELIKHVEKHCSGEVVVVLHAGGQLIVEDWIDLPKIGAVLFAGYPGQETGNAIVDILWGDVNPSAKGKGSYPKAFFGERLAIDYKWYDQHNITPRFEFGHGLSYTTFEMSSLNIEEKWIEDPDTIQKTNEAYDGHHGLYDILYVARVNVTNTGKVLGAEVAQLYMTYPSSEKDQPPKHLRGYSKVYLYPGQTGVVEFHLRKKDLSVWDVKRQKWVIPTGKFIFRAGNSSANTSLDLEAELRIDSVH
ncbi:hypothetical protein I316_06732 [Kwoniella heveanensis BCC8398]|uniref:Probable beta-glucosidase G n=1 Tax=Kwoniella heveanensis BCC8398 TaxID=1296120 RepID=A0A1B9GKQ2_9TREE|nr:hypothetical protein I316_06732 [Kwoniella heveanensis BCC8398]